MLLVNVEDVPPKALKISQECELVQDIDILRNLSTTTFGSKGIINWLVVSWEDHLTLIL